MPPSPATALMQQAGRAIETMSYNQLTDLFRTASLNQAAQSQAAQQQLMHPMGHQVAKEHQLAISAEEDAHHRQVKAKDEPIQPIRQIRVVLSSEVSKGHRGRTGHRLRSVRLRRPSSTRAIRTTGKTLQRTSKRQDRYAFSAGARAMVGQSAHIYGKLLRKARTFRVHPTGGPSGPITNGDGTEWWPQLWQRKANSFRRSHPSSKQKCRGQACHHLPLRP